MVDLVQLKNGLEYLSGHLPPVGCTSRSSVKALMQYLSIQIPFLGHLLKAVNANTLWYHTQVLINSTIVPQPYNDTILMTLTPTCLINPTPITQAVLPRQDCPRSEALSSELFLVLVSERSIVISMLAYFAYRYLYLLLLVQSRVQSSRYCLLDCSRLSSAPCLAHKDALYRSIFCKLLQV